ncbi:hypothetical protein OSB04_020536 [Centaurea solstitialis]|uniref:Fe2OG dioxygenase domain-containing protein n=1 Tax=Centaurea solstitialis TaxID=347529 RepID=A0AA38SSV4_9ASTR|nr:hypothetical protein OSB04_020536 [Centaurea solstitialis]
MYSTLCDYLVENMEMKKEGKDSRWFDVKLVPNDYIFPQIYRPENLDSPLSLSIPVIDLQNTPIQEIFKASQDFGFFQVMNHGVSKKAMDDAMSAIEEFFNIHEGSGSVRKNWIYTKSIDYAKDGVHLWRENLKHPCYPLEKCIPRWPNKPSTYQEVIAAYIVEIRKLSLRIFEMICKGLGLDPEYLNDMSEVQILAANFYPPCPDPSLTLGSLPHRDPSLITILNQAGATGLQVMKDGEWVNVGAIPNSLVVNIGCQLEIISNGKLKSVEHRVVTNMHEARRTLVTHVNPSPDSIIEPASVLVSESEPPRFKAFRYRDFVERNRAFGDYTNVLQNGAGSES